MMNLVRWNPWREMTSMHNQLNRMFDSPVLRNFRSDEDVNFGLWNPAVDLYEKEDSFVIKAELPGMKAEDLDIQVTANSLSLSGERKIAQEGNGVKYHRREREGGSL